MEFTTDGFKVLPTGAVLRQAVISAVQALQQSEDTEIFCLYILRAMKNPAIIESDLAFLREVDTQLRASRLRKARLKRLIIEGAAAVAVAAATYITVTF